MTKKSNITRIFPPIMHLYPRLKRLNTLLFFLTLFLMQHVRTVYAADTNSLLIQDCDFNQTVCSKKIGNGYITLGIEPKPVKAMKELMFTVTLKGMKEYESLRLKLQMPGMFMGNNDVKLVRTGSGKYTGKGVIPKCHSGKKEWSAIVEVPGSVPPETSFLFNVLY